MGYLVCNHCGLKINPGGRIPLKATMDGTTHLYHTACYMALPDGPFTDKDHVCARVYTATYCDHPSHNEAGRDD